MRPFCSITVGEQRHEGPADQDTVKHEVSPCFRALRDTSQRLLDASLPLLNARRENGGPQTWLIALSTWNLDGRPSNVEDLSSQPLMRGSTVEQETTCCHIHRCQV